MKSSSNIFLIVSFLFLIAGCSSSPVSVPPPDFPDLPSRNLTNYLPSPLDLSYNYNKEPVVKNNVSVRVVGIMKNNDERFSTEIDGFSGSYVVSITPALVDVEISNGTDHIITMRRTILRLEDNNQRQLRLINNIPEQKQIVIKKVQNGFARFDKDKEGDIKNALSGDVYVRSYESFAKKVKEENGFSGSDFAGGLVNIAFSSSSNVGDAKKSYVQKSLKNYHPEELVSGNSRRFKQKSAQLLSKAIQKISSLPNTVNNVITNGVYQPINILPGRKIRIVALFDISKDNLPEEIHVGLFDLPTIVNQAGDPTKRDNFNFILKKF